MKTKTILMAHVKDTKGTHVYATEDAEACCTTVYLRKGEMEGKAPRIIKLTIEVHAGEVVDADAVLAGELKG